MVISKWGIAIKLDQGTKGRKVFKLLKIVPYKVKYLKLTNDLLCVFCVDLPQHTIE